MIDSIDVMNILEKVIQPNIKMILILVVLIVLATQNLETNTIVWEKLKFPQTNIGVL